MPNLAIPEKSELQNNKAFELKNPKMLFKDYTCPFDLLEPKKFFDNSVFQQIYDFSN